MPLSQGQVLNNRYRIVKLLGQGGFGAVYRAWDTNLNGPCAVKENFDASPAAQAQFQREASMLFNLRHPNLPKVFDSFTIPGQGQYLVMEYIEGEDIAHILERTGAPLEEAQALDWIGQVCDALIYLHSQNPPVIHRDIKPANIRITPQGLATLVDFGIAKLFDSRLKTTMGARAVTAGFSPPEQYGTGSTDAQSDVYALGATLYNLLTRLEMPSSVDIISGSAEPPAPVHTINPRISPQVSAAIERAMQLNRAARFGSVLEFKKAILQQPSVVSVQPSLVSGYKPTVVVNQPAPDSNHLSQQVDGRAQVSPADSTPQGTLNSQSQVAKPAISRKRVGALAGVIVVGLTGVIVVGLILWMMFRGPGEADNLSATGSALADSIEQATADARPTRTRAPTDTLAATWTPGPTNTLTPTETPVPTDTPAGFPGMVFILAGEFQMGSESKVYGNEKPVHTVSLDAFYMDVFEVTNAEYAACVQAGVCTPPGESKSYTRSSYYGSPAYGNYPVIYVDSNQARAYCQWQGGDLPTEAQWEKAARGGLEGKKYPWGDEDPVCQKGARNGAKFDDDAGCNGTDTEPVGSYSSNGYGLYDMAGNVWEWVQDWYQDTFYSNSPLENPTGPSSGQKRVLRGGSWYLDGASSLRAARRYWYTPSNPVNNIGFRCARVP